MLLLPEEIELHTLGASLDSFFQCTVEGATTLNLFLTRHMQDGRRAYGLFCPKGGEKIPESYSIETIGVEGERPLTLATQLVRGNLDRSIIQKLDQDLREKRKEIDTIEKALAFAALSHAISFYKQTSSQDNAERVANIIRMHHVPKESILDQDVFSKQIEGKTLLAILPYPTISAPDCSPSLGTLENFLPKALRLDICYSIDRERTTLWGIGDRIIVSLREYPHKENAPLVKSTSGPFFLTFSPGIDQDVRRYYKMMTMPPPEISFKREWTGGFSYTISSRLDLDFLFLYEREENGITLIESKLHPEKEGYFSRRPGNLLLIAWDKNQQASVVNI